MRAISIRRTLFGRAAFDRVLVSYALSMIPPWREALAQAIDVVADGGALQIVDFGDQAGLPRLLRAGLRRWLAAFDVTPRDALGDEVAALAQERGARARAFALYGGYAVRATVDRPGRRIAPGAAGPAPPGQAVPSRRKLARVGRDWRPAQRDHSCSVTRFSGSPSSS